MRVLIGGQAVDLEDRDLLGIGGEARVYRWQAQAVKVYHPVSPALGRREKALARKLLEGKLAKVRAFPAGLPPQVVSPVDIVEDARGQALGFTMKAVAGAEDVLRLGQRKWREGKVSNEAVSDLFRNLHEVLGRVHGQGVIVGDLNDSNVLFSGSEPWLIDADSMQFGGHPCVVGHERFLDPRLFGADLTAGCHFTPETDWYSFAVLLFASLLYVHPYGGVHKAHPTLLRRAEARCSVLGPDVLYPKNAVQYGILPDALLDWFEKVFDKGHRGVFPRQLLEMRWTACRCGTEHARPSCPVCTSLRSALVREAVRFHGKCRSVRLLRTRGRILHAAVQGNLKYLVEEDGIVRREDGTRVLEQAASPAMRFAIAGASTWLGLGNRLVRIQAEQAVERCQTQVLGRLPVFDAAAGALYRLENEWLLEHGSGMRIGKILEGQTWLRAGEHLGFGFYRAGLLTVYFLFRRGLPGLVQVALPPLDGRLVDAAAAFDERHVLFSTEVEKDGVRQSSMFLLRSDGSLVASATGPADGQRMLASVHGKAVSGGHILCAADEGLLLLAADAASGQIHEAKLYTDTEPFVQAGAELLPGPDGTVYVVTTREITQLSIA
jgi:hypothetical protein